MTNLVITAYCACMICCGNTNGITASGARAKVGVTCAANWVPLGTRLRIEGVGDRIVQDRMSTNYPSRVDVFFGRGERAHTAARRFGKRINNVKVIL
jgi:3D (Asp-Asp-Asp) domain-containing protein